jgi:hypothetical protein
MRNNLNSAASANPLAPDDMLTCLSKAAAAIDKPAIIVTFSRAPAEDLMSRVFGAGATANLIALPVSADGDEGDFTRPDGASASPLDFEPDAWAVFPRFIDFATLERVALHHGAWLARAAGIIVRFPPARMRGWNPSEAGFLESCSFITQGGHRTTIFFRQPEVPPLARDRPQVIDRPALRRLVIVDPCLGVGRGHFLPYAQRITEGAQALGADVVWGCHRRLDGGDAPTGVEVRRCFPQCFFDLSVEQQASVDLSPELLKGWLALLGEFDGAGTHFLVHTLDGHLLRAAAGLLEMRPPMRSVIHLSFNKSPRRMPGRAQGAEAHRVVMRLRRAPEWERSLFVWTEHRRLSHWMSQWLRAPVPIQPFLSPSGPGEGVRRRTTAAGVTISVLGASHAAKGFLDLPELMDHIAASPLLSETLKVVIQNWTPFQGAGAPHEQAVARLRRHPFVEIVEGRLDADDYARRLAETDVLLLPYHQDTYGLRGSGILIEGLSRAAIILVRAGTSMEDSGEDGVVLGYETPQELVEVLNELVSSFDAFADKAREMADRFRRVNTPEAYVGSLDARARGKP